MAGNTEHHLRQHWANMQNVYIQHPHEYNGSQYLPPSSPQEQHSPGSYIHHSQLPTPQKVLSQSRLAPIHSRHWDREDYPLNHSDSFETSENYGSEIADSWKPVKVKPPNHVRNSGHWNPSRSQEMLNYPAKSSPLNQHRTRSPAISNMQNSPQEPMFNHTSSNLPGFSADAQSDDEFDDDHVSEQNTTRNSQNTISDTQSAQIEERQRLNDSKNNKIRFKNFHKQKQKKMTNASTVSSEDEFEYHSASEPIGREGDAHRTSQNIKRQQRLRKISQENLLLAQEQYPNDGGNCQTCMSRIPFATLIATVMCCVGVGVFCGTMYRGSTLTLRMFEDVFKLKVKWVEPVQLTFMIVGAGMGGLGLMILFVGCLSTGDTRAKVYNTWRGRVGGRISCAVLMTVAYLLILSWLLILCFLMFITLLYTLAWLQCANVPEDECIEYNQFGFLFPASTLEEDKRVCPGEKKIFCKDYVNNAEVMFILATVSAFLVIVSLIHYLMCLAANYAHIKNQEKFMELRNLQDMQFLTESEMSTLPKNRF